MSDKKRPEQLTIPVPFGAVLHVAELNTADMRCLLVLVASGTWGKAERDPITTSELMKRTGLTDSRYVRAAMLKLHRLRLIILENICDGGDALMNRSGRNAQWNFKINRGERPLLTEGYRDEKPCKKRCFTEKTEVNNHANEGESPQLFEGNIRNTELSQNNQNYTESCSPIRHAEKIYDEYPRKVARKKGIEAIEKALKDLKIKNNYAPDGREWHDWLIDRVRAYAAIRNASHATDPNEINYTPHPATWFNGARFDDDFNDINYAARVSCGFQQQFHGGGKAKVLNADERGELPPMINVRTFGESRTAEKEY